MFKVKQKVSGCLRTEEGANNFAVIMSFVSTAVKQKTNAFTALKSLLLDNF
jgi:transposase